ncbi:hypothetical protein [Nostoc sp. JL23]|uniref:hypothetical protein n=1 Tax=Nostoc sp. JL23 TaxID=2815394 RepID=UPI001D83537B|nr:hypothetical protein [Nostoc sp. JL23]MBN3875217.1 hypothetical protein [Nostoc sp. JL23]
MYFILDEGHNCIAVDFAEWSAWCKVDENCEVAEDFLLGGQIRVSTVFTGIDSEALPNKPPKTFLTIVFVGCGIADIHRYLTWDEALIGHKEVVNELKLLHDPCICDTAHLDL